jgi:anti-anti-sigma factor
VTEITSRPDGPAEATPHFRIDDGGAVRLCLVGELDLAAAPAFAARLSELSATAQPVRLDLARLEFIDSMGLRELILAVSDARRDERPLAIDPSVSEPVRRVIDLCGVRDYFWPAG